MKKPLHFLFSLLIFNSYFCFSQNHPPIAVNDNITVKNGDITTINVRANDYDPDGNPIRVLTNKPPKHGTVINRTDSTITFVENIDFFGHDTIRYILREITNDGSTGLLSDTAYIFITVLNSHRTDSLDINNINARINYNGNNFWDLFGKAKFEVPKGSGKCSIFNSALWVSGHDSVDSLHLAAERYLQNGNDYWPGPISNVYDSAYDDKWDRVWKITKADIDYHNAHCWQAGYVPSQAILDWPGNGDTTLGQSKIIAPFYDWNHDGKYDPYAGDFPIIKGDEAVLFIINDDRNTHTESHGTKLGLDIIGMAYAFACNEDSALWNTLFINYKIINRSPNRYQNSFIGLFTDLDLGYANDDYIGCDVQRGSFYAYNGQKVDGTGQSWAYGAHPPAQSVTFLAGPYMDSDGIDNPTYDQNGQHICDASINGTNFGNGFVDDERLGLTRFIYFNNSGMGAPTYGTDPSLAKDYDYYLQGKWKDGTQMLYGGNAHTGTGAYGPACNFMFPGNSDTCNWGTGGAPLNGPQFWSEVSAGNQPDDRRGLGSSGPFTFESGASQEFDVAFVFGRDFIDTTGWGGVVNMQQRIDSVRKYFVKDKTPCGESFSSIANHSKANPQIKIFPNPSEDFINVELKSFASNAKYEMFDIVGKAVASGILRNADNNKINISYLPKGLYFLNVTDGKNTISRKFIKQ